MELKLCPKCERPLLADVEKCPHCGNEYEWNQESWLNVGCMMAMIVFVFFLILLPFLMIGGMFFGFIK